MLCPAAEDAALCEEYVRGYWVEITAAMYPKFLDPKDVCKRLGANRRHRHLTKGGRQEHALVPKVRSNHGQHCLHLPHKYRPSTPYRLQSRRSRGVEDLRHGELSARRERGGQLGIRRQECEI